METSIAGTPPPQQNPHPRIGIALIGITCVFLLALGILMIQILFSQLGNYQRLIDLVTTKGVVADAGIALAFARAFDIAVIKTCCLFLSFMLILLGGLYTFRVGESSYRLSAEGAMVKGSLETASPGLVMLTLGIVTISMAIWRENTVGIQGLPVSAPAVSGNTAGFSVNTSSGVPAANLASIRDNQILAINTAFAILDAKRGGLDRVDGTGWDAARSKLDTLRRELLLGQFPELKDKWADWSQRLRTNPDFAKTLPPNERAQLEAAQRLLGENLLPK